MIVINSRSSALSLCAPDRILFCSIKKTFEGVTRLFTVSGMRPHLTRWNIGKGRQILQICSGKEDELASILGQGVSMFFLFLTASFKLRTRCVNALFFLTALSDLSLSAWSWPEGHVR